MKTLLVKAAGTAMLTLAVAATTGVPARAYQIVQKVNQAEARDPSGQITVEASVISTIQCDGPGENSGQYFIYQYVNRAGFRAIEPPKWSSPIGGRDFATFEDAAGSACRADAALGELTPPPEGTDLPLQ